MAKKEIDVGQFVKTTCLYLKDGKRMTPQMQREWKRVRKLTITTYGMDVWSAILKGAMKNGDTTTKV